MKQLCVIVLCGACLAVSGYAQTPAADTDLILSLGGMDRQCDQIADSVLGGMSPLQAAEDQYPGFAAMYADSVKRNYAGDRLLAAVRAECAARHDAGKARLVIDRLGTPLFRKMTELEVLSVGFDPSTVMRLDLSLLKPGRKQLVEQLMSAVRVVEMSLLVMEQSVMASYAALEAIATGREKEEVRKNLDAVLEAVREQRPSLEEYILKSYALTYRDLTDGELSEAVAFYLTDAGKWYLGTTWMGLTKAYKKAAEDTIRDVLKFMEKIKSEKGT